MKQSAFFSSLSLVLGTYASPVEQNVQAVSPEDWAAAPQGQRILPSLKDSPTIDGAKRKEILYGPYTIPAGEMVTKMVLVAESPCTNCYVTAMHATIKYPDGREALTSEGAWLHHTVLASLTNGAIWAAGNERPTIRLNGQAKYGIDWPSSFGLTADIMSEKKEPMTASMSITYEYIEKNSEMGKLYKPATMFWNQIGFPLPSEGKTTYKSWPWTANINGKMLYAIGHMHDGGTNMNLFINGKLVCNSTMFYSKGARPAMGEHGHSEGGASKDAATFGGDHISNPGACTDFGTIKKGDIMTAEAYYDMKEHTAMTHKGKPERLMGNMRVYMGPE